jgi:hypothetical protein
MKTVHLLILIHSLALVSVAQAKPNFNQLLCTGYSGKLLIVSGLGTDHFTLAGDFYENGKIKATHDGDCEGRNNYCVEDGQWMINIPEDLASGQKNSGSIWENGDTDDRPENHGLGDRYSCIAVDNSQ